MVRNQIFSITRRNLKDIQEANSDIDPLDIFVSLLHVAHEDQLVIQQDKDDLIVIM